ncbi:hypothetical protein [Bordetella trematum]|uniref:hypothetical protein n=1 Tax=Bordetella trematum TaxID=123899 RepID=UPI000D81F30E|nr:hypothetical protein [Bordetella trematum]SPU49875.1 Uncharacterised protein [Bordetella trematum]VDH07619.1 Uncharacterised protein [Bordetella trematum]
MLEPYELPSQPDSTERMTADQARTLARNKYPSFAMDTIIAAVEAAAREGRYEVVSREFGFSDGACVGPEDDYPPLCRTILAELRALGYSAVVKGPEENPTEKWLSVTWTD